MGVEGGEGVEGVEGDESVEGIEENEGVAGIVRYKMSCCCWCCASE